MTDSRTISLTCPIIKRRMDESVDGDEHVQQKQDLRRYNSGYQYDS
jgi:hypothetical protein